MSTAIGMPKVDRNTVYRPGLGRLTTVEMRKMTDTRAGFWLLLIIAAISVLLVTISIFAGPDSDRTYENFFEATLVPTAFILPVLGVLMVTSEWSQRTALATFTLVPDRIRIAVAKLLAGIIYALLSIVTSLLVSGIGYGIAVGLGRTETTHWGLGFASIGGAALFLVRAVVTGIAFGMLLMNSPVAIVLNFVLPFVFTILAQAIPAIQGFFVWLDISGATTPLIGAEMTGQDWAHFGTASLFWIFVPFGLGIVRLIYREVK